MIALPEPQTQGQLSLEECLNRRRSSREFNPEPITLTQISQILWAGQGITRPDGGRTSPSAGALYPLEIILVAGNILDLDPGIYQYHPEANGLELMLEGDKRDELAVAALDQNCVRNGTAVLVIASFPHRITGKYGQRGHRYLHMESGHAAQNIYLQAAAMGLGTVVVGAFHDTKVRNILQLPENEQPLYILPVGYPV